MSFENADSNIIDGKVQNLSQSRVQYALSAFKPTECLNWVNHRIFTPKLVFQKCQIFFSLGIFLTFLGKIFNISAWSEIPTISYNIFSHLHRIVIYQKNQSNHRLFLLFNLIRQINRPIRIRPAQILKTAKKWKKNFRKLSKKFLNSKNFWNRRTKGLFLGNLRPVCYIRVNAESAR